MSTIVYPTKMSAPPVLAPRLDHEISPPPRPDAPESLSADALKAVADLLGGGAVVAYRPAFAHVFGGASAALLLSQFWFWSNCPTVRVRGDGWFWKPQREISEETGLTRRETETARRKLTALGVLHEDRRGVPATMHYRLDRERLYAVLWAYLQAQSAPETPEGVEFARNSRTSLHKSAYQDCTKAPNKFVRNAQTIPENTSEKTQEKTSDARARSVSPPAPPETAPIAAAPYRPLTMSDAESAVIKQGAAKVKAAWEAAHIRNTEGLPPSDGPSACAPSAAGPEDPAPREARRDGRREMGLPRVNSP